MPSLWVQSLKKKPRNIEYIMKKKLFDIFLGIHYEEKVIGHFFGSGFASITIFFNIQNIPFSKNSYLQPNFRSHVSEMLSVYLAETSSTFKAPFDLSRSFTICSEIWWFFWNGLTPFQKYRRLGSLDPSPSGIICNIADQAFYYDPSTKVTKKSDIRKPYYDRYVTNGKMV